MGENNRGVEGAQTPATPLTPTHTGGERVADSQDTTTPEFSGKSPAFQFYPKDFLTDENVRLMSMQERGIYITLMSYCWIEGTLPADTKRLSRLCGMPQQQFNKLWKAITPCFDPDPLNQERIIHPRLDKERVKQIIFRRRQSDKGRASGASRRATADQHTPRTETNRGSTAVQKPPEPKPNSSGFQSSFASSDSSQPQRPEMASGHIAMKTSRFVVFGWLYNDIAQLLGPHLEQFALDEWFQALSDRIDRENLALDKRQVSEWVYEQTVKEAKRRGIVVVEPEGKAPKGDGLTAEKLAAGLREARERGVFDDRRR